MRTVCLLMAVLLCVSCSAKRQDSAGGQESASAQSLIKADGEGGSSAEPVPAPEPVAKAGEASQEAAPSIPADVPAREGAPAKTIAGFDFDAARVQPTCYLADRDSFLSRSYYETTTLYLVGFSPDGKMAFLKEVTLDGKGGTDLYFIVQDLVSDEILWELRSPSDDEYALGQDQHKRFIADYGSQIDKKLSGYGIVISPCEYKKLPYSADGLSLSATIESHDTGKLMYEMFNVTSYSCIVADGKGRKKKVIADREFMGPEAFACGCVKSPYEDRLAIVVVEATFGFEGCDLLVRIAGCDLKKGF